MTRACESLITATLVLILFELAQSGLCPPCYRDQAVLQGHGPAAKWNNARDTHSNPPNSYKTPFHFESGSFEQADFRVVAKRNTGHPAEIDLSTYPHEIKNTIGC